jgi:hypothetical protein
MPVRLRVPSSAHCAVRRMAQRPNASKRGVRWRQPAPAQFPGLLGQARGSGYRDRPAIPAGRQGRANTGNEADRLQRCRHREAHAQRAGLDPKLFAGHSLRSGFLTNAPARGASIFKMADQSRHKSMDTLRGYVRDAEIFKRP